MTEADTLAEVTLALAQRASEPSAADAARNLAALRARLGLPGGASTGGANTLRADAAAADAAATSAADPGALATARQARVAARGSGLRRLVTALTATGITGFLLGVFVGAPALYRMQTQPVESAATAFVSTSRAPAASTPAASTPAASTPAASTPAAAATEALVSSEQGLAEAPAAATVPGVSAAPPAPRARGHGAARAEASRSTLPRATAARSGDGASEPDFREAVRWLRRAQRAVRRGEAALALGLLDELDARFPRELLGEERRATRVLGLCGIDELDAARGLARELLERNPRSIYVERLRASCAAPAVEVEPAQKK